MPVNTGLYPGEPVGSGLNETGARLPTNSLLYARGSVMTRPIAQSDEVYAAKTLGLAAGASQQIFANVAGKLFTLNYIDIEISVASEIQLTTNKVLMYWSLAANTQYHFLFTPQGLQCYDFGNNVSVKNNGAGALDIIISAGGTHL